MILLKHAKIVELIDISPLCQYVICIIYKYEHIVYHKRYSGIVDYDLVHDIQLSVTAIK